MVSFLIIIVKIKVVTIILILSHEQENILNLGSLLLSESRSRSQVVLLKIRFMKQLLGFYYLVHNQVIGFEQA